LDALVYLALSAAGLVLAYVVGDVIERRHYRTIRGRETATRRCMATTAHTVPEEWSVAATELVTGHVVISVDHFKRFLAGLRAIVGGRVKSFESLLDRARREALLRMKEEAIAHGCEAVINVRIETSRLASARREGKGTAGVEVLAFGTAIRRAG
jgi:uncharacterized protein YbjQ (UPF0145 family)